MAQRVYMYTFIYCTETKNSCLTPILLAVNPGTGAWLRWQFATRRASLPINLAVMAEMMPNNHCCVRIPSFPPLFKKKDPYLANQSPS